MFVSVIICTHDRPRLLQQALHQMLDLRVPPGVEWELLVVDNGATTPIDSILRPLTSQLPLRKLREPSPGKSHALNRAVREARGDYLIFTDDDALVDGSWLAAYCAAFECWPDAAVFGGPIEALFEGTPPRWLRQSRDRLGGVFAERNFGSGPVPLTVERVPFGANLAIRAAEHARYRYPTALGPRPGDMVRGEDTAVVRAMLTDGLEGRWVPDARVRHLTPADRQTVGYVWRYFVGHGRQLAAREDGHDTPVWLGRPRWVWRAALAAVARCALRPLRRTSDRWVEDLIAAGIAWGRLRGPRDAADVAVRVSSDTHQ